MMSPTFNKDVIDLKQSKIRAISRRCHELGGINLGQGICDLPIEPSIKEAAIKAIRDDKSIYTSPEGILTLREKIAEKVTAFNRINVGPEEVLLTHGATGAFVAAAKALFNAGDEVIMFEPYYAYHRSILELFNIKVKIVSIDLDDLSFDLDEVKAAITEKTKAILICTPSNPCGKVFTQSELTQLGDLAVHHHLYVLTDEMYEYITYPGHRHVSLASLSPDYFERTITISGFSKTYNMTGWRLGYAVAPKAIIEKMTLVSDLFYICMATPLQYAACAALDLPEDYYRDVLKMYLDKRDFFISEIQSMGLNAVCPEGAYYTLVDIANTHFARAEDPAIALLEAAGVAAVDGRAFFDQDKRQEKGAHQLRFCFSTDMPKLVQAIQNIKKSL